MCIARSGRSSRYLRSLYERTHFDYRWYKSLTGDIHAMHIREIVNVKKPKSLLLLNIDIQKEVNYKNGYV